MKADRSFTFAPPTLAGEKLNKRERLIFDLMTQGLSSSDISYALFIAEPTVRSRKSSIYAKCGVRGQNELMSILLRREREAQELLVARIAIAGEVA